MTSTSPRSVGLADDTVAVLSLALIGLDDRRFNRSRYDADATVEEFVRTLRDDVDLDSVRADLLRVTRDAAHPATLSLWLRSAP